MKARKLTDKEAMLQRKEEENRQAQGTLYDFQMQKSQLEVTQKLLLHSEKELQRQGQTLTSEVNSRENALKEKEEKFNEASKSLQALMDAQSMKDREIKERLIP